VIGDSFFVGGTSYDTSSFTVTGLGTYPKPMMAMIEFLTPARRTNPVALQGGIVTIGKPVTGHEGEGTCQLPDYAKGTDV
jgi:hypothetical protein